VLYGAGDGSGDDAGDVDGLGVGPVRAAGGRAAVAGSADGNAAGSGERRHTGTDAVAGSSPLKVNVAI